MSTEQWGFQEEQPRAKVSRGPLYFLIASGIILLIALIAVVMTQMIGTGRNVAEEPIPTQEPTSAAPTDSGTDGGTDEPTDEESADPIAETETALVDLPNTTTCSDISGDSRVIFDYVNAHVAADTWQNEAQDKVVAALTGLDETCNDNKRYVLDLQEALVATEAPPQLNAIASDDSWISLAEPAPADAIEIDGEFSTSLQNIWCEFVGDGVNCTIYDFTYPNTPSSCEGWPQTYRLTNDDGVKTDCDKTSSAGRTYDYGTVAAKNGFACSLEENAVRCWSELTGEGFEINRDSEQIF